MGELREGETFGDHVLKPPKGFFTLAHLRRGLHIGPVQLEVHLKALGIHVGPFIRNDIAVKNRVYKQKRRWLTAEEAKRVIERVYALRGRKL